MCGRCHAMTVKEAEEFYRNLFAGRLTERPTHVSHDSPNFLGLLARQQEELDGGAFDDEPDFRAKLQSLCTELRAEGENPEYVEHAIVMFRNKEGRPMYSDLVVSIQLDANRAHYGLPALVSTGGDQLAPTTRVLESVA